MTTSLTVNWLKVTQADGECCFVLHMNKGKHKLFVNLYAFQQHKTLIKSIHKITELEGKFKKEKLVYKTCHN